MQRTLAVNSGNSQSQVLRQTIDKVADSISQLVIQEQQAMNDDFTRMSGILQEAAENLRDCFNEMSHQRAKQSAQPHAKNNENNQPAKNNIQALTSATSEINSHAGKAIRSLQFEDIMQQMINHSRRRAEEIEKLFVALTNHISGLNSDETLGTDQIIDILENCLTDINEVEQALDLKNPVRQQSLAQGDVELF